MTLSVGPVAGNSRALMPPCDIVVGGGGEDGEGVGVGVNEDEGVVDGEGLLETDVLGEGLAAGSGVGFVYVVSRCTIYRPPISRSVIITPIITKDTTEPP